jgi:hypothetical protein
LANLFRKSINQCYWGIEDWRPSLKWTYTYNAQNNRTEELCQEWLHWLDEWENDEKMSYTYDEHNNATEGVYQKWANNTWINASGWLDLYYNNMNSMWYYWGLFKFSATYIKTSSNAISEHRVESVLKLYPNPTTGVLTINNEQLTMNNIEIFDVYGRKVSSHHLIPSSSHQINISHLPSGVYIVKMNGVCQKVVKQ